MWCPSAVILINNSETLKSHSLILIQQMFWPVSGIEKAQHWHSVTFSVYMVNTTNCCLSTHPATKKSDSSIYQCLCPPDECPIITVTFSFFSFSSSIILLFSCYMCHYIHHLTANCIRLLFSAGQEQQTGGFWNSFAKNSCIWKQCL